MKIKRQSGKTAKLSSAKICAAKRINIPLKISLISQYSLMRANLGKLSLQKSAYFAAFQAEQKKIKYNFSLLAMIFKRVFTSILIVMVLLSQTLLVSGFEAHVINVTAKICDYSYTRTIGYWKNNPDIYKHLLPQTLGDKAINTIAEADNVLNFNGNASIVRNKLEAQLLGMKFNIFYYHIGGYFVESEGKTLYEIVADADALLLDPNVKLSDLTSMKDLLDDLNTLGQIKMCPTGIVINEFLANSIGNDAELKKGGEWIELYNLGNADVDLKGWAFYDLHDENELLITGLNTSSGGTIIKPKDFLIVYRNGNKYFNLNNTFGDSIRLYNSKIDKGILMDIYSYTVDSPEGKSFALVPDGSTNWVDPVPTPGEPNSQEGEELEFGPAQLEAGEDTVVLNTDIMIVEEIPSTSEIIPVDDPAAAPLDNISENSIGPIEPTPIPTPTPTLSPSPSPSPISSLSPSPTPIVIDPDITGATIGGSPQPISSEPNEAMDQEKNISTNNEVSEIYSGGSSASGQISASGAPSGNISTVSEQTAGDEALLSGTPSAGIGLISSGGTLVPAFDEISPSPSPEASPAIESTPAPVITEDPRALIPTPEPVLVPESGTVLESMPLLESTQVPELTPESGTVLVSEEPTPIPEPIPSLKPTPAPELEEETPVLELIPITESIPTPEITLNPESLSEDVAPIAGSAAENDLAVAPDLAAEITLP